LDHFRTRSASRAAALWFKIFRGQNDGFLEEYRLYHRDKNGLLVKENDDAISAARYGLMSLRFARTSIRPPPRGGPRINAGGWMAS